MSLDSIIRSAITPIVPECVPDVYEGTATEYCTFNYSRFVAAFADNKATQRGYSVQIHYFAPSSANILAKITQLSAAIENADMAYPDVVNATDAGGQHYVFETVYTEAV